jgi:hypothetical protein
LSHSGLSLLPNYCQILGISGGRITICVTRFVIVFTVGRFRLDLDLREADTQQSRMQRALGLPLPVDNLRVIH